MAEEISLDPPGSSGWNTGKVLRLFIYTGQLQSVNVYNSVNMGKGISASEQSASLMVNEREKSVETTV